MPFEPETWTPEQYLGRAEAGRTKPLRLSCSRKTGESDTARDRAEFYAKFTGLSEVTEQMLFAEMLGNALARASGISTGEPAFIEIDDSFATFLRRMDIRVRQGLGVGSRNLGQGLSPPTFGRMSPEQLEDAARLYLFDLVVQNPDRQAGNSNCLAVGKKLFAIDFGDCFSFLYPIVGVSAHPWDVSRQGIAARHVFHQELKECVMDWPTLTTSMLAAAAELLEDSELWMPVEWTEWAERVHEHFKVLQEHEQELVFEVARSVA
jgi:hypothetical protein